MPQINQVLQNVIDMNRDRLRPIPAPMLLRVYFGQFFAYFLTEVILADQAPAEFREGRWIILSIFSYTGFCVKTM